MSRKPLLQANNSTYQVSDNYVQATNSRVQESVEVTTRTIVTAQTYACRLAYIFNCIHDTSFGAELLACVLSYGEIKFLERLARFQKIFFHKGILAIFVVALLVFQGLYVAELQSTERILPFDLDPWMMIYIATGPAGFCFIMILIDLYVLLTIDQSIQVAFSASLSFPVSIRLNHLNEFVTYTKTQTETIVHTDLSTHILAAQLEAQSVIKVMIFREMWVTRYLIGTYRWLGGMWRLQGVFYSAVFFLYFVFVGLVFGGALYFEDDSLGMYSFGAIVAILIWAKLLSPMIYFILSLVFGLLNLLMGTIPSLLWQKYIGHIYSKMMRRLRRGSEGSAILINRRAYTLSGY